MRTKYNITDRVFAIDTVDGIHTAIHIVEIVGITIHDEIEYFVKCPFTNEEWGDCIPESQIGTSTRFLIKKLKIRCMILKALKFKRTADSKWEAGIGFESNGECDNIVIDINGNYISGAAMIHDIKDLPSYCMIDLEPILKRINKDIRL